MKIKVKALRNLIRETIKEKRLTEMTSLGWVETNFGIMRPDPQENNQIGEFEIQIGGHVDVETNGLGGSDSPYTLSGGEVTDFQALLNGKDILSLLSPEEVEEAKQALIQYAFNESNDKEVAMNWFA